MWHPGISRALSYRTRTLEPWVRITVAPWICVYSVFVSVLLCGHRSYERLIPHSRKPTKLLKTRFTKPEKRRFWATFVLVRQNFLGYKVMPLFLYYAFKNLAMRKVYRTSLWCIKTIRVLFNPLKTKRRPLYLKTQSVPRCKHFSSRL